MLSEELLRGPRGIRGLLELTRNVTSWTIFIFAGHDFRVDQGSI